MVIAMGLSKLLEQLELLVEKKDHLINRIDSLTPSQKDEIISFFQKYPQHESKIDWNKIKELTYDDFKKVIQTQHEIVINTRDSAESIADEGKDYIEIDSIHKYNKAFLAITSKGMDYLASKKVGGIQGIWCVAGEQGDQWFNVTYKEYKFIVYVTKKNKYAIALKKPRVEFSRTISVDDHNRPFTLSEFEYKTGVSLLDLILKNKMVLYGEHLFKPDSNGNIIIQGIKLETLEGAPKTVKGNFHCINIGLKSLTGCPLFVADTFNCSDNEIETLVEAPKVVGSFICNNNNLISLQGTLRLVYDSFYCSNNNLTSLKGVPKEMSFFNCSYNNLTSLEGAPEFVEYDFDCSNQKNGHKFTEEEVRAVCDVGGKVYV